MGRILNHERFTSIKKFVWLLERCMMHRLALWGRCKEPSIAVSGRDGFGATCALTTAQNDIFTASGSTDERPHHYV
jgi:hypothetical protein